MNEDLDRHSGENVADDAGSLGRAASDARRTAQRLQRTARPSPKPAAGGAANSGAATARAVGGTAGPGVGPGAAATAGSGAGGGAAASGAGTAAGGTSTSGAAAGGGAAAGSGASAGGVAAGGVAILIVVAVVLLVLALIGLFVLIPSAVSNGLLHQNDPAALSSEIEIFDFGDYEDNEALLNSQTELFEAKISSILSLALSATEQDINAYAASKGWVVDWSTCQRPMDSDSREISVFLLGAYCASIHNGIGDDQWDSFMDKTMLEDMADLMIYYLKNGYPYTGVTGNSYYAGDFARDDSGEIAVRSVSHRYTDPLTGEVRVSVTKYVAPIIYDVNVPDVAEGAFLVDSVNEPYDPQDPSPTPATYWDVTLDMAQALGDFLYGEEFWETSSSFWGGVMTSIGASSNDIVKVATSQLGNGGRKYQQWFGVNSSTAWCAIFASWCADQCGYIEAGICPKTASTGVYKGSFADFYQQRNRWMPGNSDYQPKAGDFILFLWDSDRANGKRYSHVAIVTSSDGEYVYYVGGNQGARPGSVTTGKYKLRNRVIVGYGVPDYPVGPTTMEDPAGQNALAEIIAGN